MLLSRRKFVGYMFASMLTLPLFQFIFPSLKHKDPQKKKNFIMNGDFHVWKRGEHITLPVDTSWSISPEELRELLNGVPDQCDYNMAIKRHELLHHIYRKQLEHNKPVKVYSVINRDDFLGLPEFNI